MKNEKGIIWLACICKSSKRESLWKLKKAQKEVRDGDKNEQLYLH